MLVPFVAPVTPFITRRCYDQTVISVAYSGLNVKVVGTRPGITSEQNGGTHFSVEDAGIMRNIPGFVVVDAADNTALKKLFPQVLEYPTPVYLRFGGHNVRVIYNEESEITIGKANVIRKGKDATIIANDLMVGYSLDAAEMLAEKGIDVEVIDMHTIKPIDKEAVINAAKKGRILKAENHSVINGLGSAVAEVIAESGVATKLARVGVQDRFGMVGWETDIGEELNMRPDDIVEAMIKLLD